MRPFTAPHLAAFTTMMGALAIGVCQLMARPKVWPL